MCNVIVNLLLKVLCFYSWVKVTNLILLKSNQQGEYSKKDRNKIFSFQKLVVTCHMLIYFPNKILPGIEILWDKLTLNEPPTMLVAHQFYIIWCSLLYDKLYVL